MHEVTRILAAIEEGDSRAVDELLPAVYQELRHLAAQKLVREKPGQTLQATALVHEAYLRLVGDDSQNWSSRTRFFTAAAEAMRRILIENARRKKSHKHGGRCQRVDLRDEDVAIEGPSEDVLDLDEALTALAEKDPVKADLVKLRYFAGLTGAEAAQALGLSHNTADEYWAYARAWLRRELTRGSREDR